MLLIIIQAMYKYLFNGQVPCNVFNVLLGAGEDWNMVVLDGRWLIQGRGDLKMKSISPI